MKAKLVKESLTDRSYSEKQLKQDLLDIANENNFSEKQLKKAWKEVSFKWYGNRIHTKQDIVITLRRMSESLNETSLADMYREMGTWFTITPEMAARAEKTGITTENSPELQELVDGWMEGMYDEDPGNLFNEIEYLIDSGVNEEWRGDFEGDTPADQGMRAAARDNARVLNKETIKALMGEDWDYYSDVDEVIPTETLDYVKAKKIRIDDDLVAIFSYATDDWNALIKAISREGIPYHIAPDEGGESGESILVFNKKDLDYLDEALSEMRVVDKGMYVDEEYMEDVLTAIIHGNMGFFGGVGEEGKVRDAFEERIMDDPELSSIFSSGLKRNIPARMMAERLYKIMNAKGLADYGDVI